MASTPNEKSAPTLNLEHINLTTPPKALTPFDTPTGSLSNTPAEKVIELRRDSGPTTPHSCRNDNPFDTDVEAMITTTTTNSGEALGPRKTQATLTQTNDCPTVWPSAQHWKQKAKTAKKTRHCCNCMAGLSKRNRILVKVLILLLIVGIGLGVGFGVSRTLNAPIWGDKDTQR